MFEVLRELTMKQEYDEKVQQTAVANSIKKSKQAERKQPSILANLFNLVSGPQRQPAPKASLSKGLLNH